MLGWSSRVLTLVTDLRVKWQSNERGTGRKTLVFSFPVVGRGLAESYHSLILAKCTPCVRHKMRTWICRNLSADRAFGGTVVEL